MVDHTYEQYLDLYTRKFKESESSLFAIAQQLPNVVEKLPDTLWEMCAPTEDDIRETIQEIERKWLVQVLF